MYIYFHSKIQGPSLKNDWVMAILNFWPPRSRSRQIQRSKSRSDLNKEISRYNYMILASQMTDLYLFIFFDLRDGGRGQDWDWCQNGSQVQLKDV